MDFINFFYYGFTITEQYNPDRLLMVSLIVGCAGFAVMYVFKSFALFYIARRDGYKNRWMAFVPILSTYYLGPLADKNKLFGQNPRIFAAVAAALEALLVAGWIIYYVSFFSLLNSQWIMYVYNQYEYYSVYEAMWTSIADSTHWMYWVVCYLDSYVLSITELVFVVFALFAYIPFFQTYSPRGYYIMAIFSALFPISGILDFVIRKNAGRNYREYLRIQQERQYRMYQQGNANPYNYNPYSGNPNNMYRGNGNPYANQPQQDPGQGGRQDPAQDPFDEFGGEASDPFGDFGSESGTTGQEREPAEEKATQKGRGSGKSASKKQAQEKKDDSPFDDFD